MHRVHLRRVALLGVASQLAFLAASLPRPAAASPVEYVKICSLYGVGFFYIPGTDTCADGRNFAGRTATEFGVLNSAWGVTYGQQGYTGATSDAALGNSAWAGGNPNGNLWADELPAPGDPDYTVLTNIEAQARAAYGGIYPRGGGTVTLTPPGNPGDPGYDADYASEYASLGGVYVLPARSASRYPISDFSNTNDTALGGGAMAGATEAGQDNATAVGQGAQANALNATAIGQGAQANIEGAVALGQGSIADVANTVSVGRSGFERKIVNVAAGAVTATSTDAVVGSQLFNASSNVAAALGGGAAVSASGAWTGPTYTVQGSEHTDVGSALTALDAGVTDNAADISDLQTDVTANTTAITDLQTDVAAHTTAITDLQTDVTANTTAITGLQTSQTAASGRIDDLEDGIEAGTIGLVQQEPDEGGITVGADTDGAAVSFAGTDGDRRLTGVAAGVMGTDVVNVAQMQSAIASASAARATQLGDAPDGLSDPDADGEGALASGYGAHAEGGDTTAVGTNAQATFAGATAIGAGARATADPTTAVGFMAAATGNNASAFGGNATASGVNSTAVGESAVASAADSTALGRGATVSTANSVAIGAGSTATRGAQTGYAALGLADPQTSAGEVSVGTSSGARQVTNVAAGSAATDAVNVGQLEGVRAEALGYTDLFAAAFNHDLDRVNRRAEAGSAAAMAAAGLVQATEPGSSMVTGGVGSWRGSTALAFGLSHRFEGAWTIKAAGSYAEHGGGGFNAAFGFEF